MSESGERAPDSERASALLERLADLSPDLLDAAILGPDGVQISSSDGRDWSPGAARLWAAADAGETGSSTQLHVGTEDGEVFAVRDGAASIVSTSRRFALASLMLTDLRTALRDFERGGDA
jgi:hypothetical protein